NRGDGLAPLQRCGAVAIPGGGADLANGRTFLVDMNGDRLLDLVTVTTRSDGVQAIQYFPATGFGGFGRGGRCGQQGVPVVVDGDRGADVPGADFLNFAGFERIDVTNDGLADLLWLGPDQIVAWVNIGGSHLRRVNLGGYPAGIRYDRCDPRTGCDPLTADVVDFADINGNGTRDALLVDRQSLTA